MPQFLFVARAHAGFCFGAASMLGKLLLLAATNQRYGSETHSATAGDFE